MNEKQLITPIVIEETFNTLKLMRVKIDFETESIIMSFGMGNTDESGNYQQIKAKTITRSREDFNTEMPKIFNVSLDQLKEKILDYGEVVLSPKKV